MYDARENLVGNVRAKLKSFLPPYSSPPSLLSDVSRSSSVAAASQVLLLGFGLGSRELGRFRMGFAYLGDFALTVEDFWFDRDWARLRSFHGWRFEDAQQLD